MFYSATVISINFNFNGWNNSRIQSNSGIKANHIVFEYPKRFLTSTDTFSAEGLLIFNHYWVLNKIQINFWYCNIKVIKFAASFVAYLWSFINKHGTKRIPGVSNSGHRTLKASTLLSRQIRNGWQPCVEDCVLNQHYRTLCSKKS